MASLDMFFNDDPVSMYSDEIDTEIRTRITLSIYAYAYEYEQHELVSDATYDKLSYLINPNMETRNFMVDKFFREQFGPETGMWICRHPELDKIKDLYNKYFKPKE